VRRFWAWTALGATLIAVGSGLLWWAYERSGADRLAEAWTGEGGTIMGRCGSIFAACEEFDPTLWYTAGSVLVAAAAASLAVAARARARG
jgi:hypothetical protein